MHDAGIGSRPGAPRPPTPRRARGLGRIPLDHGDLVAVVGQDHGSAQAAHSPTGDHDRCHALRSPLARRLPGRHPPAGRRRTPGAGRRGQVQLPAAPAASLPTMRRGLAPMPRRTRPDDRRGTTCAYRSRSGTSSAGPPSSTGSVAGHRRRARTSPVAGPHHLRRAARPGPGHGPGLDALGVGARRAGGHRQPQLGPASCLVLRGQRLRPGARPRSTSGLRPRRSSTSSSTQGPPCCS